MARGGRDHGRFLLAILAARRDPGSVAQLPRRDAASLRQFFRRCRNRLWPHRLVLQSRHDPALCADTRRCAARPEPRLCAGAPPGRPHGPVEWLLYLAAEPRRAMAQMRSSRLGPWLAIAIGAIYFLVPLIATFEFSLRMKRGEYSFEAYRVILEDPRFQASFGYSALIAVATIVLGVLLVVPTAYWVQYKLRALRPIVEFITLMPLVIPPIVLVFGYLRAYNSSSLIPFTSRPRATDLLLIFGYVTLSLPYMYRAVDTGLRSIDVRTLTEAALSLGAGWGVILFKVIFPNVRAAILSGAFLTFAIVIGEFTLGSLLDRPAFGPYLQLIGANRAYEPSALAIVAFAVTWACMGLIQLLGRDRRATMAG